MIVSELAHATATVDVSGAKGENEQSRWSGLKGHADKDTPLEIVTLQSFPVSIHTYLLPFEPLND